MSPQLLDRLKLFGAAIAVVIGIMVVMMAMDDGNTGDPNTTVPTTSPAIKAKLLEDKVINPGSIEVTFRVRNVTSTPVLGQCTVNAQDPSGAYSGWEQFSWSKEIPAGEWFVATGPVIITNDGAAYVTDIDIDCEPQD